jgi:hypothetical protein
MVLSRSIEARAQSGPLSSGTIRLEEQRGGRFSIWAHCYVQV